LSLVISQIQGNMSLKNLSDPTHLDLTNNQTQDNMSLINTSGLRHVKPQGNNEHVKSKAGLTISQT